MLIYFNKIKTMHIDNMNTIKQQPELIFTSLFVHSLKHFCLFFANLELDEYRRFSCRTESSLFKDIYRAKAILSEIAL